MKKIKALYINIFIMIYLEFALNIIIFSDFTTYKNYLYMIISAVITGVVIKILSSLFNEKENKIINIILIFLITIIFGAQLVHYRFYEAIFSFYSLVNGGQVFGFFSAILKVMWENVFQIIILLLPVIALIVFQKRISFEKINLKRFLYDSLIALVSFLLLICLLYLDNSKYYSAKTLYFDSHVPTLSCKKLGLITTMRLDLKRFIFGFEETVKLVQGDNAKMEEKTEYNVMEIDFDELAKNTSDNTIKEMHNYFGSVEASEKNKYTGMFEGKNLILLVAEAFSPIAINEEITPTLYKMYNEGFQFTNFYTPIFFVSTSDGEYVTLTSLLPKEGVWSFYRSRNNSLPFVYGNEFKSIGYTTQAYHNGNYQYYDRDLSHPNMGYQKWKACGNGMQKLINCKKWPQSDLEMINATVKEYVNQDQFLTYYMTISGHLNYNFGGNNMASKNKSAVNGLKYSDAIKAYYATQIELDKALESLIKQLDEAGKLDDTVIALSADHYPYGLTTSQMKEVIKIDDAKFDIHQNNFLIWNSEMKEPIVIDKYASSLDTLPTILNLFNIEYDSRLLMGRDILSNSDGLVIFSDRSWITEKGKYNALTKKFTAFDENVDSKYIEEINSTVYNKFVMSRLILDKNYYKYLSINTNKENKNNTIFNPVDNR